MFACCRETIMTAGAGTQYLEMVDLCGRFPGIRAVAVLTDFSGVDVFQAFSGGADSVMAVLTVTNDLVVVNPGHGCPPCFQMAVLALVGGGYVVCWNRRCLHQPAAAMATGAFPWGTFKHTSNVAGCTVRCAVTSLKRKAG